jgi:hypothetical protein
MKELGLKEIMYFFTIPLSWVYPPGIQEVFRGIIGKSGITSPSGIGSNAVSPLMLSKEVYQLLGVPVEHIYLTAYSPHVVPLSQLMNECRIINN